MLLDLMPLYLDLLGDNDFNLTMPTTTVFANCIGQRLRGLIILKAKKDLVARGVFVRLFCEEKTSFMKFVQDEYKTTYRYDTVESKPFNKIFNVKVNPDQAPLKFTKGVYCFRFDVPFPHSGQNGEYLSGSFQTEDRLFDFMSGYIMYGVEAFIEDETGAKKLHTSTVNLKALPKYDIRDELHKAKPLKGTKESYTFFGVFHEYTLSVTCPTDVFLLGQTVSLAVTVANSKSKPVKKLKISIRSCGICPQSAAAGSTTLSEVPTKEDIWWDIDFPVPAKDTKTHQIELRIPKDFEQSIMYSRVMQRRHYLWVRLSSEALLRFPIVIVGTPRITSVNPLNTSS